MRCQREGSFHTFSFTLQSHTPAGIKKGWHPGSASHALPGHEYLLSNQMQGRCKRKDDAFLSGQDLSVRGAMLATLPRTVNFNGNKVINLAAVGLLTLQPI